jgi:hypothetical protein
MNHPYTALNIDIIKKDIIEILEGVIENIKCDSTKDPLMFCIGINRNICDLIHNHIICLTNKEH